MRYSWQHHHVKQGFLNQGKPVFAGVPDFVGIHLQFILFSLHYRNWYKKLAYFP